MNKLIFVLVALFSSSFHPVQEKNTGLYDIEQGKISIRFCIQGMIGIKTIVWKDYGSIESTSAMMCLDTGLHNFIADSSSVDSIMQRFKIIRTTDSIYTKDLNSGKIQTNRAPILFRVPENGNSRFIRIPFLRLDTFLNLECRVYKMDPLEVWYWKGIPIRKYVPDSNDNYMYERAVSIDTLYEPTNSDFRF